ncbi:LysR family transcriptional regulator [Catenisphaera adipataccumulans]|jgi:DNA-binding transcriptional LysR family regulator|uniref:DNA-binding transcriptional LysR family regulator n=1 Tax=Catenisphaera adipataccumulans TaxID=700500 RepID=A0A7W8CZY0_9FIRM|nr:LysR family transcriptional regulator [Catenisphaera adipataccumulans]MBB5183050.1 DNA-binding transcriptional LysR family regulator [Catenisphaera adipataccumulans]
MTLQQIFYALTTADMGSMNKAAEKLYISQPTLTSAIKELEGETGITIFNRTSRGVTLTADGRDFLMYARQIYQQYELLKEKYSPEGTVRRKFSVSCQHYSFAVKAFANTVNEYDPAQYEFAIKETRTLDVIDDVAQQESEIGILYLSSLNRKYIMKLLNRDSLEFHPLVSCSAYVYLYKGHPLGKEKEITFEQLQDYPYLSFEQGKDSAYYLAEEILSENDYARVVKVNDRATALNLMVGINGYMLCSGIIDEELNGSDFIAIPYKADSQNPNAIMEIGYIVKKNSILSDAGRKYIECLKEYFNK